MPTIANRHRRELFFFLTLLLITSVAFTVYIDEIAFFYDNITIPHEYKIHKHAILNNHQQLNHQRQVKSSSAEELTLFRRSILLRANIPMEYLRMPLEKSSFQRLSLVAFQQTNSRYR